MSKKETIEEYLEELWKHISDIEEICGEFYVTPADDECGAILKEMVDQFSGDMEYTDDGVIIVYSDDFSLSELC